jgi:hypothetical protein
MYFIVAGLQRREKAKFQRALQPKGTVLQNRRDCPVCATQQLDSTGQRKCSISDQISLQFVGMSLETECLLNGSDHA